MKISIFFLLSYLLFFTNSAFLNNKINPCSSFGFHTMNSKGIHMNKDFIAVNGLSYKTIQSEIRIYSIIEYLNKDNQLYYMIYIEGESKEDIKKCISNKNIIHSLYPRKGKKSIQRKYPGREEYSLYENDFTSNMTSLYSKNSKTFTFFNSSTEKTENEYIINDNSEGYHITFSKNELGYDEISKLELSYNDMSKFLYSGFIQYFESKDYKIENLYKGIGYILLNMLEKDKKFEEKVLNFYLQKQEIEKLLQSESIFKYYRKKAVELKKSMVDVYIDSPYKNHSNETFTINYNLYRGASNTKNIQYEIGKIVKSSKFISTSIDFDIAYRFKKDLFFKIIPSECKVNINCMECRGLSLEDELEVLIDSDSYFQIINISYKRQIDHDYEEFEVETIELKAYCGERTEDILELS